MEIKNLKKAASRIKKAIEKKENIILYGDADLDGVTSVIILRDTIRSLGGAVLDIYFPDRETEGYGITAAGLDFLKKSAPALLVAMDCGISNFKEVKLAKKLGFKVVILDHHEVLDRLPAAEIIVDPKQKGERYPFREFAAVGVVFKLCEALLKEKMTDGLRRNFLELVALATTADMMPRVEENKIFIEEGFRSLERSPRPGIKALFESSALKEEQYSNLNQKVSKIISLLNFRDVKSRLPASFRLLTVPLLAEGKDLVQEILEKSQMRRELIRETARTIEEEIEKNPEPVIFAGNNFFELTLISSAASILCHKYQKPTFVFKKMEKESQGTVRTPSGVNGVELMKKCSKYLLTYGGHPQAAGFRLKNENIDKFKNCLIQGLEKMQKKESGKKLAAR